MSNKYTLPTERTEELFVILRKRFHNNMSRHQDLEWIDIETKLRENPNKMWSINEMEETAGEPDAIGYDIVTDEYLFCDCAIESPKGRRSTCYDQEALESRKEHKPKHSAKAMAEEMGIELLTEIQYKDLQQLGRFDTKTSSWLDTPDSIRELGGAIFGDLRFGRVFVYHNGAESYYAARGFRGLLRL